MSKQETEQEKLEKETAELQARKEQAAIDADNAEKEAQERIKAANKAAEEAEEAAKAAHAKAGKASKSAKEDPYTVVGDLKVPSPGTVFMLHPHGLKNGMGEVEVKEELVDSFLKQGYKFPKQAS